MAQRIFIKDWLLIKPYSNPTTTDNYYLKICNQVREVVLKTKHSKVLQKKLENSDLGMFACFLTSYLEDLISGTNIWNSFVRLHKRLYNKPLPFYNCDEYFEEEVNAEDISLLIWYYLNNIQDEKLESPFNDFIVETAEDILDVFDKAWEYAPENKYLSSFYQIDENEDDYYKARNLIDTILFKSYLFMPDTLWRLKKKESEIIEEKGDWANIIQLLNDNRDHTLHTIPTRLLCLKGKEWAAEIIGKDHSLYQDFLSMSPRLVGLFLYKGQDQDYVFLEHVASDKRFNLTKKSFDHGHTLKEIDTILVMGIVLWKGEWWFSGMYFEQPYNADLIAAEKMSRESKMEVRFLDQNINATNEELKLHLRAFLEFNNGQPIAFMPASEIDGFFQRFVEYLNNSLAKTEQERREAKLKLEKKLEQHKADNPPTNYCEVSDTGLVFFNPKSGIEIAMAVNSAFPLAINPYFNMDESVLETTRLLMSEYFSAELAFYCIEKCESRLPFFNDNVAQAFLKDIDFLLRYWKRNNYHPKPNLTIEITL